MQSMIKTYFWLFRFGDGRWRLIPLPYHARLCDGWRTLLLHNAIPGGVFVVTIIGLVHVFWLCAVVACIWVVQLWEWMNFYLVFAAVICGWVKANFWCAGSIQKSCISLSSLQKGKEKQGLSIKSSDEDQNLSSGIQHKHIQNTNNLTK